LLAEEAKERQKEAGAKNLESFKNGDSLVSEKIHELTQDSEPDKPQERRTDSKIAKTFGTNQNYVSKAKKVKEHAPELLSKVASGEMDLNQAAKEAGW
jgi:hypothetical protein